MDWSTFILVAVVLGILWWPYWEDRAQRKREERRAAFLRQMKNLEIDLLVRANARPQLERLLIEDLRRVWAKAYVEELVPPLPDLTPPLVLLWRAIRGLLSRAWHWSVQRMPNRSRT